MSTSLYTHGLLGLRLSHSFSERFFSSKFAAHSSLGFSYGLFELKSIKELAILWQHQPLLRGLNVTFPYKESVCDYLDELHPLAERIGAVNVLKKLPDGRWKGYNTDYAGFGSTLSSLPREVWQRSMALICGTGGSAKAVGAFLEDVSIRVEWVSRQSHRSNISYEYLQSHPDCLREFALVVQATPLGTLPNQEAPFLPYEYLSGSQFLYDLAYNPPKTPFLRQGEAKGCLTKNGLDMLYAQAEESWQIWKR